MMKFLPYPGVFEGLDEDGLPKSDRDYNDDDFARYISEMRSNGVVNFDANPMIVTSAGGIRFIFFWFSTVTPSHILSDQFSFPDNSDNLSARLVNTWKIPV